MALDPKQTTLVGLSGNVTTEVAFMVLSQSPHLGAIVRALGVRLEAARYTPSPTVIRLGREALAGSPHSLAALGARAEAILKVPGITLARELELAALPAPAVKTPAPAPAPAPAPVAVEPPAPAPAPVETPRQAPRARPRRTDDGP